MDTSKQLDIPDGLSELLHDFTVSVLMEKPKDLHAFAAHYFTKLNESQIVKKVPMYVIVDEDDKSGEPEKLRWGDLILTLITRTESISK